LLKANWQFPYSSLDRKLGHKRRYSPSNLKALFKPYFKINLLQPWNFTLAPFISIMKKLPIKQRESHMPKAINAMLAKLLILEAKATANHIAFPYGISLAFVARNLNFGDNHTEKYKCL
jgi:hypothetical protein